MSVGLNNFEAVDSRFWQEGVAGGCNIVAFDGEDVRGIAFVANAEDRKRLIERHNSTVRQLLRTLSLRSP